MREATQNEIRSWDELVRQNPDGGETLQTRSWGDVKGHYGWKPHYVMFDELKLATLFLSKRVPLLGEVWYAPKGPGVATIAQMTKLPAMIKAAHPTAFVIKVEPEITGHQQPPGWVKASMDVHISQATYKINLKPDEDRILLGFKQKTRYNIRLAERKGVKIHAMATSDQAMSELYRLIGETQARAGFLVRSREYCYDYWRSQSAVGQGQIFLAELEGQIIAGAYVQMLGTKAWYKDGGSDRRYASAMAPYFLQWEIMRWLREKGIIIYDLVGAPKNGDVTSPLQGLVQFKAGFNGEFEEFIGTWDLPLVSWKYAIWSKFGERALLKLHSMRRKLWY